MFALSKLFAALATLADNLSALAGTVAEANGHLRARLTLDGPAEVPALPHQQGQDGPQGAEEGHRSAERPRRGRKGTAAT
jgi:hypothetical protein